MSLVSVMVLRGNSLMEAVLVRIERFLIKMLKKRFTIIALFIIIASAISVTAQSNMDCRIFNQSLVPGDMVPLINMYQGNDSHVEYSNLSNYNYTIACNSSMATLDYGCTGSTYLNVIQLYNYTDA